MSDTAPASMGEAPSPRDAIAMQPAGSYTQAEFRASLPFVRLLGFELLRFESGEAEIAVDLRDELTNSWGVVHGGVTMTLLDVTMAHAARASASGGIESTSVVTIEMKTSFMRPGLGRLVARGRLIHRSPSMAFCEATLFDADDQVVAHATGTFKFLKALAAGARRIERHRASD
jgi:uncharacterized protein (TIGR00369 family)